MKANMHLGSYRDIISAATAKPLKEIVSYSKSSRDLSVAFRAAGVCKRAPLYFPPSAHDRTGGSLTASH